MPSTTEHAEPEEIQMTNTNAPEYLVRYTRPNYGDHQPDAPIAILGTELVTVNSWGDKATIVWFRAPSGDVGYLRADELMRTYSPTTLREHFVAVDAEGNPQPKAARPVKLYDNTACQAATVHGTYRELGMNFVAFSYENDRPGAVTHGVSEDILRRGKNWSAVCRHVYGVNDSCPNCDHDAEVRQTETDRAALIRQANAATPDMPPVAVEEAEAVTYRTPIIGLTEYMTKVALRRSRSEALAAQC